MLIKHTCKKCGIEFEKTRNRTKKHDFCSRQCAGSHRKTRKTIKCFICGKDFECHNYLLKEKNFCSSKCYGVWLAKTSNMENCPMWKGGTYIESGYVFETIAPNKQVRQHVIIMESMLGRPLVKGEIVHHIDGNKQNNDPENLLLLTQSEHMKIHCRQRREKSANFKDKEVE